MAVENCLDPWRCASAARAAGKKERLVSCGAMLGCSVQRLMLRYVVVWCIKDQVGGVECEALGCEGSDLSQRSRGPAVAMVRRMEVRGCVGSKAGQGEG